MRKGLPKVEQKAGQVTEKALAAVGQSPGKIQNPNVSPHTEAFI